MSIRRDLLSWQWSVYPGTHTTRTNLLIHLATAPLFWIGVVALIWAAAGGGIWPLIGGIVLLIVPVMAQGSGHKREPATPAPFLGADDFVTRFFFEQTVTLPRYVLTGGWARAFSAASRAGS